MGKLYRSVYDKKFTGLCGGLAKWLGFDATLLRLVFVLAVLFTGGTVLIAYLLASLVVPKEPIAPFDPFHMGPGAGPYHGAGGAYGQNTQTQYQHTSQQSNYHNSGYGYNNKYEAASSTNSSSNIDSMMEDIEKKALQKELEQLRAKVAQYEKGDK